MDFFPLRSNKSPKIYAYTEPYPEYEGLIKVGYTEREVSTRMQEHYPTAGPDGIRRYEVLFEESSMREDGTFFKDYEVHRILENSGVQRSGSQNEWFKCSVEKLKQGVIAAKDRKSIDDQRYLNFSLRPEQKEAIKKTKDYFNACKSSDLRTPHFLWNCKMRFGKTFTTYKLAKEMNWNKILILSFKTAVEDSWAEDLMTHVDFDSWQFIQGKTETIDEIDEKKPYVCFASFQDFLGKNKAGGIKIKNEWAHKIDWDCIVLDEYHYGAWNENSKGILSKNEKLIEEEEKEIEKESGVKNTQNLWDEKISPLKTNHYLYLSGTPFRAIQTGEFIEDQIYNWTYTDEQNAKENWTVEKNPYESMPRMVMMTYKMPESISQITNSGEFDEFDLNEFFKATGEGENAKFKHEDYVQKWLNLIRGSGLGNIYSNLKYGNNSAVLPFSDTRLLNQLTHTFWFLPSVASCFAMKNLIMQRSNAFYHDYKVIVCAGAQAGIGKKALGPVRKEMQDPLKSKTITLSCGKLNTGVTVRPWTGVFILRNTSSPETYFQTAFRVQSPWSIAIEDSPNKQEVLKKECYIFDFAPSRALKLLTDYCCSLNINNVSNQAKVEEFIKFLPVISFDGSSMTKMDAHGILDFCAVGTTGSQLAKAFQNARSVNVDDATLSRIMNDKQLLDILMKIEGFKKLNSDIEKIISQSEKINNLKKEANKEELTEKQNKELTEGQKEQKGLRKKIRDQLLQFENRIPIFMYLTDFREETLKDIILKLDPKLFKQVTSITTEEFEVMLDANLYNSSMLNTNIAKFKLVEDASLHYKGLTKHDPEYIGLWDTRTSAEEFYSQ
tara:strand:- start:251 stop:2758 length:2508 start_codon:yes stop_codon:yes gene_type:complete